MYDSLLVATDGSEAATTAIEHAVGLATRLEIPVYGIAVLESRTEYDNAIVDPAEVEQRRRAAAESALEYLEEQAAAADVPVETTIRSGVPHEEVLAYADERDAGAVVIGARGRSSFKRALLGATVDRIVRLADRPVLVVGDAE
ncbi:universal stress protein [Salinadaptatus halalkaliphilus]|uniref:Universal stress protein n=1 Tax=Salinadaptatus halalkaliphilus TaxID=2419781 RepID=A0A4S3TK54_9EURY|nr:universal stress protein [Salinadaptatus halalkaliphilus]THE62958.1 universal stress protein [Salinadaptatus halalkaliphilus]